MRKSDARVSGGEQIGCESFRKELKYYGLHACWAIWEKRPQDVIRLYLDSESVGKLSRLLKWCASKKIAYHIIESDELEKVSASVHHEGICMLAREPLPTAWPEFQKIVESSDEPCCLLYLDGVQNPHNIGSIMRISAHFGVAFILGEAGKMPALSPSACRIAKGGAEAVRLVSLSHPIEAIQWLRKRGFSVVGASSHGGSHLYGFRFTPRTILAMGSESDGLGRELIFLSQSQIRIPGTGQIESLNVSVASSLVISEYYRQHSGFSSKSLKPGPSGPGSSTPNLGGVRNPSQIIPRPLGRDS